MGQDAGGSSADNRKAWEEVGKRFAEVGRRVSERYRSLGQEGSESADRTGKGVSDAVESVVRQLDQAFTSVGDTLRDPEAKESLRRAVRSFADALDSTFAKVRQDIRPPGSGPAGDGTAEAGGGAGSPT